MTAHTTRSSHRNPQPAGIKPGNEVQEARPVSVLQVFNSDDCVFINSFLHEKRIKIHCEVLPCLLCDIFPTRLLMVWLVVIDFTCTVDLLKEDLPDHLVSKRHR